MKQKTVLALHDLACFGRSSLVPIISVLSSQGHQCVPVPTAVFSTHTAIENWSLTDLTGSIMPIISHFENLNLNFDAVYSGFLGSAEQIDCVLNASKLKAENGCFLVDPVMGDNGKIYKTYTSDMTKRMSELCHAADCITPNVTEAAVLLEKDPSSKPRDEQEAEAWLYNLYEKFGSDVVITGLNFLSDKITVACISENKTNFINHPCENTFFHGTGDIFASVLLGQLLCGKDLNQSAEIAADFVRKCISYTANKPTNRLYGVEFEHFLYTLPHI